MRFDWYQASIPSARPEVVMEALSKSDFYGDWEQIRPLKNYDSAAAFVVGNETRFKINFGGQNEEHGPNVVGSGASARFSRTSFVSTSLRIVFRGWIPVRTTTIGTRMTTCESSRSRSVKPIVCSAVRSSNHSRIPMTVEPCISARKRLLSP